MAVELSYSTLPGGSHLLNTLPAPLHIDFESFSNADLRTVGAYRYAFDPSTEILCAAMALGENEPSIWFPDYWKDGTSLDQFWDALENPEVLIYAHNATMEMAICQALLQQTWGIPCPDLSRFRCTMSLARRAALPGKLEKLAEVLGLANLKDNRGKALIKKFSMMQPAKKPTKKNPSGVPAHRIRPEDDPTAFAELLGYCKQDVRTEQEVGRRLAYFDEPINNSNYSLDARINARGVTVNIDALRHAQKLIEEETELVGERFRKLTGFEVTQNARFLEWLHAGGIHLTNLQAETIENFLEALEDWPDSRAVKAIRMKQSVAYASIKKVAAMLACAGPHDNRIRGMLNHHGATTGRWTNSLVQFQNMKRPTIKHSEDAYREICNGISREMLEICYGPVLEVISSCIRHFVHDAKTVDETEGLLAYEYIATQENPLLDADYSAIEARIVNWLAGQEDALDEYRQGIDRYVRMASVIYSTPEEEINKFPQRFVGKHASLGCGFGMGPWKFRETCKRMGGYDLPLGLEDKAVQAFRAKHPKVKAMWNSIKEAAKKAIVRKGEKFTCGKHLAFKCLDIEGMTFLLMRLPSGRKLSYPQPKIINGDIYIFRKTIGVTWEHQEMNGCTLLENATQAVAADIMAEGAHKAERAGYEIATLIHDQALAYHRVGQTAEEFVGLLTDLPAWAEGLPIEAEGSLVPFYKKD